MDCLYRKIIILIILTAGAVGLVSDELVLATLLFSTASLYGYIGR